MVKKESNNKKKKGQKKENSRKEETNEDFKDDASLDNDFFVENADEFDYELSEENEIESESEKGNKMEVDDDEEGGEFMDGSDLDYDDDEHEDEEVSSNQEKKEFEDENDTSKKYKLTKEKFKKIKDKALKGNKFFISQSIFLFNKALNLGEEKEKNEEIDDNDNNLLNNKNFCIKVIKFCLVDVLNILQLNQNKILIKKMMSSIYKLLKKGDLLDDSLIILTFSELYNNINLVKQFKAFTEVFIKLAVKYWTSLDIEGSAICLNFLCDIAETGEFDYVLKTCYLGFLGVAKANNKSSYDRIQLLMENIVYLLQKNKNSEAGYKNVFLFLRKLSIELNRTILDKKWNSIKNIYNWQVINSLFLWFKVIENSYSSTKEDKKLSEEYKLLTFPLIQITLGVIRLHNVSEFFPLRIHLLEKLISLSEKSGIFIPIGQYILEILQSNIFTKIYTHKDDETKQKTLSEQINEIKMQLRRTKSDNFGYKINSVNRKSLKKKLLKLLKKQESLKGKHKLSKIVKIAENDGLITSSMEFNLDDLHFTLKIKEFNHLNTAKQLLKSTLNLLRFYSEIQCYKISFPEVIFPIVTCLKKILKEQTKSDFKLMIKDYLEALEKNFEFMSTKRKEIKNKEFIKLKDSSKIAFIEKVTENKFNNSLPIKELKDKLRKREDLEREIEEKRESGGFIEI